MIYEVREYVPMPGRLPDVIDFFRSVVIPLFRKHEHGDHAGWFHHAR